MAGIGLRVPLTKEDRKEMQELGKKQQVQEMFYKTFAKWDFDRSSKRIPHCAKCVLMEWGNKKDELKRYLAEAMENPNVSKREDLADTTKWVDFGKYEEDYMEVVESNPISVTTKKAAIDGMVIDIPVEFNNYRCKAYGHGMSIENIEETQEKIKKTKK